MKNCKKRTLIESVPTKKNTIIIILLIALAFLTALFSLGSYISKPSNAFMFVNPDFCAYTYLAYNLIYEHGSLFLWHIGSAPYYFPEILVLYLITLVSTNTFYNLLAYAAFQIACVSFLIPSICKAAIKNTAGLYLGLISIFSFLATILIIHSFTQYYMFDYLTAIFAPGFHYGAAILVFISTFLFIKILDKQKFYMKALLFLVLIIAGLSDPLTCVYFTFPMVVCVGILWLSKKITRSNLIVYIGLLALSFILSFTIYKLIPIHYVHIKLNPTFSPIILLFFLKNILLFIQRNKLCGVLWLAFMFLAPVSLWKSLRRQDKDTLLIDYVILLQFVAVIVSTPLIILAIKQTLPASFIHLPAYPLLARPGAFYYHLNFLPYRYMINYFIGPIFLGIPLLLYKHYPKTLKQLKNPRVLIIILIAFIALLFIKHKHFHTATYENLTPNVVKCLDKYATQYNLSNGVSDNYYVTNVVNSFSNKHLHVALIGIGDFSIVHWQNTLQLYQYNTYNFAISNKPLIGNILAEHYGPAVKSFICPGNFGRKYFLYIYNNNKLNHIFQSQLHKK